MTAASLIVEVVGRDGEVSARHRINRLPATIGRGYDNDVIIDDPFVAPLHVVLELRNEATDTGGSGGDRVRAASAVDAANTAQADARTVVARDFGSRNGTFLLHRRRARWASGGERLQQIDLQPTTSLRIGHTVLRIRRADQPVPPELADTFAHGWEGMPMATAALAMVLAVAAFNTWYGDSEGSEVLPLLRTMLAVAGGAALWAGCWAIFNRIFAGRMRFGRHLWIVACALLGAMLWTEASELIAYALSLPAVTAFAAIGGFAILALAIYHHLTAIRPHRPRLARGLAITLFVSLVGFSLVQNQIASRRLSDDLYLSSLKPPALRLAGEQPSSTFFEDARRLKRNVDVERRQSPGDDESE